MNENQYKKIQEMIKRLAVDHYSYASFSIEIGCHPLSEIETNIEVFTEGNTNTHKSFPCVDSAIKFIEDMQ